MPLPAGTRAHPSHFVARSAWRCALSVYGASRLASQLFEEGIAAAASAPAAPDARLHLPRGRGRLALRCSPRTATRSTGSFVLSSHSPAGEPFAEDARLHWHPALAPLAELHGEGKVSVLPAVGYTNADQSHFTSRHYWEVGATARQLRTGWLGRYLDRAGTSDNPLQGLSLADTLAPAARDRQGPRRGDLTAPTSTGSRKRRLGRARAAHARHDRHSSAPPPADAAAAHRRQRRRAGRPPAPPARCRSSRRTGSRARWRIRSRTTRSHRGLQGLPQCLPQACRFTASRSRRRASTTRMPTSRPP